MLLPAEKGSDLTALLLLPGIFFTVSTFAQGTVNFSNNTLTRLYTNTLEFGQPPNLVGQMAGPGQYRIGLYIAPAGTTDPNAFSLVGPTTLNSLTPGLFNGNPSGGFFVVPGNTGQPIAFQVRAWQASAGSSYESGPCCGVYRGASAIGSVTPATGVVLTPNLFGAAPGQVGGFALCPQTPETTGPCVIPEPSSAWLALLGAAVGCGMLRLRFRPKR